MTLVIRETGLEDYLVGGEAFIKELILGAPSAGKTRSASYWPKPILADCEKGRMSVADRRIPYAEILTVADMDALLEMLTRECAKPVDQRKYLTLIIDTIDAYQRTVIQKRLDDEHKDSLSGWADWGWLDAKMTQFVAKLQNLPMNIVVNLHVKDQTVGEDDAKYVVSGPKLKGDLKDQIAAEFDLVGYMGTYYVAENGERVLKRGVQWHPEPGRPMLKDRSGSFPKFTPITFSDEDYAGLLGHLAAKLDTLQPSVELERLDTEGKPAVAPVPPKALQDSTVMTPAEKATPKKAPAKAVAPTMPVDEGGPAFLEAPPSTLHEVAGTEAATNVTTPVVSSARAASSVPAATKPVIAGASAAPVAEPAIEAASEPEDQGLSEEQAFINLQESLGATVVSTEPDVETPATTEAPFTPVTESGVPLMGIGSICGTDSEGNEGKVPGCGKPIGDDQNPDLIQIAYAKTRTNLDNACFAAFRAANR